MMMNPTDDPIKNTNVRPATQAGRFYDGDADRLCHEVDSLLSNHAGNAACDNVAAIIVPHAGYYYSGNVAAAAYATIPTDKPYKRIFLLGPSHYEWLNGASVNTAADYYATPLGKVKVDRETAQRLTEADSVFSYRPEAHDREHCLEVQLPFLQRTFETVPPIVPIIISTNSFSKLQRMAEVLKPYFTEENLFIISSDFSHYPSYKDACEVDAKTGKAIESGDAVEGAAELEEKIQAWQKRLDEAKENAPDTIRDLQSKAVAELTPLQRDVNAKRRALADEYGKAVERLDALRAKLAK